MRLIPSLLLSCAFVLSGCTTLQRSMHLYSDAAPPPLTFQYPDGGSSVYYAFTVGRDPRPDTALFIYGATGCPSLKAVMPDYVRGLTVGARVFVLNKRHVEDRSTGMLGCSREFHLANRPSQWVADYAAFVEAQLKALPNQPRNVVLVGVSEAAIPSARVAKMVPAVTHLAIIGSGGYSLRRSLATLRQRGAISFDVEEGWRQISTEPRSVEYSWYGNRYRWWSEVLDIDPLQDLLPLDMPILVGIGEKDESVPVESARYLEERFRAAGKGNLTLKVYPGADHRLSSGGVSHRDEFFAALGGMLH